MDALGPAELIILVFIALIATITGIYFALRLRKRLAALRRRLPAQGREYPAE